MGWFNRPPTTPSQPQPQGNEAQPPGTLACSFCGKTQREVKKLIAGPTSYICDECLELSLQIVHEEDQKALPKAPDTAALLSSLERRVVGQTGACRALAAAMRQHFHKIHDPKSALRVPRVLLVGPRGSGKTTLGRALCSATELASYHADVSRLSESGYVGEDVENFLAALLELNPVMDTLAHCGVLFLDGIEKLRAQMPPQAAPRDISGAGVQRELMRLLDGLTLHVPTSPRRHPQAPMIPFPTDRLFVVGALTLDEPRLAQGASPRALREALVAFGMLPEFLARFDVVVHVPRLDADALARILVSPSGVIEQASKLVESLGGMLGCDDEAIRVIADAAAGDPDGAWALTRVIQRYLERVLTAPQVAYRWQMTGAEARALLDS